MSSYSMRTSGRLVQVVCAIVVDDSQLELPSVGFPLGLSSLFVGRTEVAVSIAEIFRRTGGDRFGVQRMTTCSLTLLIKCMRLTDSSKTGRINCVRL